MCVHFFFFNDTATTEIYTLSLHDALPISTVFVSPGIEPPTISTMPNSPSVCAKTSTMAVKMPGQASGRSEEHTSELQSRQYLVCRLLLEKKKITKSKRIIKHYI